MPDVFLKLNQRDQLDAIGVAAEALSRPPDLLEKDVWVVWALRTLYELPEAENIVFKGGTSLSKAHGVIQRFSEDIDVTYDIREFASDLVEAANSVLPPSNAQAKKWTNTIRGRLNEWIANTLLVHFQTGASDQRLDLAFECAPNQELLIKYTPLYTGTGYVKPVVKLEFGARATGEPHEAIPIACDAEDALSAIDFPSVTPIVMHAECTFWEKLTAVHVACTQHRFRNTTRFSRHWYDLVRLHAKGIAASALQDSNLAIQVANHKAKFFREKDTNGDWIDYREAVASRRIQVVPTGGFLGDLRADFDKMIQARLIEDETVMDFEALISQCVALEEAVTASAQ